MPEYKKYVAMDPLSNVLWFVHKVDDFEMLLNSERARLYHPSSASFEPLTPAEATQALLLLWEKNND